MNKEQVMDYVMTTPSNSNRAVLSGMLDGISGTQLPSPTESDNGKVLGVDGGEYKLVEQSGGGSSSDFFRIKFSTSDMTTFTCDKTFAEMKAARDAGKYFIATCELRHTNPRGATVEGTLSLNTWGYSSQTNMFTFLQAEFVEGDDQNIGISISIITVTNTDVIVGKFLSGTIQPY